MAMKQYIVTLLNNQEYLIESDLDGAFDVLRYLNKNEFSFIREKAPTIAVTKNIAMMVVERSVGAQSALDKVWRIK